MNYRSEFHPLGDLEKIIGGHTNLKFEGEGAPADNQIVLGWELETRILIIRPPFNKFAARVCDFNELIKSGKTSIKILESII